MTRPVELTQWELIAGLCEQWGYTPQEAREAPAWVLRMTNVIGYVRQQEQPQQPEEMFG